jgi:RsiW-degrading membrane proteinase PrsW (M82 family)
VDESLSTVVTTLRFALASLLVWAVTVPAVGLWYFSRRDVL